MCQAEDVEDVQAAAVAGEEAGAELAEFDETIPWDEREAELKRQQGHTTSKVLRSLVSLSLSSGYCNDESSSAKHDEFSVEKAGAKPMNLRIFL